MTGPLMKAIFSSEMFICLCRGVSDRTVQQVIDEGACTVAEVGTRCGAGTDCGACHEAIEQRIEAACTVRPRSLLDGPVAAPAVASEPVEEKAA